MIRVIFVLGVFAVIPAIWVARAYRPISADDVTAMHMLYDVRPSRASERLFAAYLSRGRRYRTSCSVAAIAASLVFAFSLADRVTFGPNTDQPWADLVLMGIGGYLLGAVLAELHHLRRSTTGPRVASVTPRLVDDYAATWMQWVPRGALMLTVAPCCSKSSPAASGSVMPALR